MMTTTTDNESIVLGHIGPAGDHNCSPLVAVPELLASLADKTGRRYRQFGETFENREQSSQAHLEDARASLTTYADAVTEQLSLGGPVVLANGRCAASLATVPRVMSAYPDGVLVWLDAHADLNVPGASDTDYLGGMAISGPLGWWDSGFGAGLAPDRLILIGTRSIDTAEAAAIGQHRIAVFPPTQITSERLIDAIGGRPVLFHLDCDVLEPGLFTTDYREADGLSLDVLADLAERVALETTVIGVEVAEWEGAGKHGVADLVDALSPLLPIEAQTH